MDWHKAELKGPFEWQLDGYVTAGDICGEYAVSNWLQMYWELAGKNILGNSSCAPSASAGWVLFIAGWSDTTATAEVGEVLHKMQHSKTKIHR